MLIIIVGAMLWNQWCERKENMMDVPQNMVTFPKRIDVTIKYVLIKWQNYQLLIFKKYAKSFFWCKRISFLKPACFSQTTAHDYICDEYFEKNDVKWERGIKGLTSGVFMDNFYSQYYDQVSIMKQY